jgi:hypothetical protein
VGQGGGSPGQPLRLQGLYDPPSCKGRGPKRGAKNCWLKGMQAWPHLGDGHGICSACGAKVDAGGSDVGVMELRDAIEGGCDSLLLETALVALTGMPREGRSPGPRPGRLTSEFSAPPIA